VSYKVTKIVSRARLPRSLRCSRPVAKLVLLALADKADDDGRNAWPSVATIAEDAEVSTKTASKMLAALVSANLITEQRPPTQHRPRTYELNLKGLTHPPATNPRSELHEETATASSVHLNAQLGTFERPARNARSDDPVLDPIQILKDTDARAREDGAVVPDAIESGVERMRGPQQRLSAEPGVARPRGASHRSHAHCGRICLPSALFDEFTRRRNHLDADLELRDWAQEVEHEWASFEGEPGDAYDFWRARYSERWPTAPEAAGPSRGVAATIAAAQEIFRGGRS
jgi:hypothetical protein